MLQEPDLQAQPMFSSCHPGDLSLFPDHLQLQLVPCDPTRQTQMTHSRKAFMTMEEHLRVPNGFSHTACEFHCPLSPLHVSGRSVVKDLASAENELAGCPLSKYDGTPLTSFCSRSLGSSFGSLMPLIPANVWRRCIVPDAAAAGQALGQQPTRTIPVAR